MKTLWSLLPWMCIEEKSSAHHVRLQKNDHSITRIYFCLRDKLSLHAVGSESTSRTSLLSAEAASARFLVSDHVTRRFSRMRRELLHVVVSFRALPLRFLRRASSRTSSPTQRSQKFPRHRALLLVNRKY